MNISQVELVNWHPEYHGKVYLQVTFSVIHQNMHVGYKNMISSIKSWLHNNNDKYQKGSA